MKSDEIPNRIDGTPSDANTSATCRHCRHLNCGTHTCAAFPDGIPDELWWSYRGHREPFPGDHGLQFSERKLSTPVVLERFEIPEFLVVKNSDPGQK